MMNGQRVLGNGLMLVVFGVVINAMRACDSIACDCAAPPPPREALQKSAGVLLARVVKIQDDPMVPATRIVELKVERWWKGGDSPTLIVATNKSGAACGYGFREGDRYLVYAHAEAGKKMMTVSRCSRTRTLAQAEKSGDFKELGEGKAPAAKP
jgi:hypothetical protein